MASFGGYAQVESLTKSSSQEDDDLRLLELEGTYTVGNA